MRCSAVAARGMSDEGGEETQGLPALGSWAKRREPCSGVNRLHDSGKRRSRLASTCACYGPYWLTGRLPRRRFSRLHYHTP
jgi:hypothetical protein